MLHAVQKLLLLFLGLWGRGGEPGELAQWLRVLAIFPQDLGSISRTHMKTSNCL